MGIIANCFNKEDVKPILKYLLQYNILEEDLSTSPMYSDLDQHYHCHCFGLKNGHVIITKDHLDKSIDILINVKHFIK